MKKFFFHDRPERYEVYRDLNASSTSWSSKLMHRFLINKIHVPSCGPHVTHRLPDRSRPQMPISIEEQFTAQILGTLLRLHELNVTVVTIVDDVATATRSSVCEAKTKDVRKLSAACIGALDFGSLLRVCLPCATSCAPLKRQ